MTRLGDTAFELSLDLMMGFKAPVLIYSLKQEYIDFLQSNGCPKKGEVGYDALILSYFSTFIGSVNGLLIERLNYPFLNSIVGTLIKGVHRLDDPLLNRASLSSELTSTEIGVLLEAIHKDIANLSQKKEELVHYISVLRAAKVLIGNHMGVVDALAQMPENTPFSRMSKIEAKKVIDFLTLDLRDISTLLSDSIVALTSLLDGVINSRISISLKMESSIRLLARRFEMEWEANGRLSRGVGEESSRYSNSNSFSDGIEEIQQGDQEVVQSNDVSMYVWKNPIFAPDTIAGSVPVGGIGANTDVNTFICNKITSDVKNLPYIL